jgi:hypothetical protein
LLTIILKLSVATALPAVGTSNFKTKISKILLPVHSKTDSSLLTESALTRSLREHPAVAGPAFRGASKVDEFPNSSNQNPNIIDTIGKVDAASIISAMILEPAL